MHCWPHFELVSPCGTRDEETIQVLDDSSFLAPNLIKGTKLVIDEYQHMHFFTFNTVLV